MSTNFRHFADGITIVPKSTSTVSAAGDIDFDLAANKFNANNGSVSSPVVLETTTSTLTNKTLSGNTASNLISGSGTFTFNTTGTITSPNATDTLVGKATSDTLSNKTLDNTTVETIKDSNLTIQNASSTTKQLKFDASGITAGQTRTLTSPDVSTTIVGTDATQTLSNKTLDNTTIETIKDVNFSIQNSSTTSKVAKFDSSGISASTTRTFTFPDASTTLVGTDATQTLTNKSISGSTNTLTNISLTTSVTGTLPATNGGTAQSTYTTGDMLYASATNTLSKLPVGTANQVIQSVNGIPSWQTAPVGGINYIASNPNAETDTSGWAGFDNGLVVTISNASPSVLTSTSHGLVNGQALKLSTTGTLPSPFDSATQYFVINSTANTFNLSASLNGAAINTTTNGSGVHTFHPFTPTTGTGGSLSGLTFSRTTSNPLRGSGSFQLVQASATPVLGQGVSFDFTINSADLAKPLAVTFDYNASSTFQASNGSALNAALPGGASDSDLEVFIYDVTNGVKIPVSPQVITGNGASNFNFKANFQTSSNSVSYRLIIGVATNSGQTPGYTFKWDNVFVGPISVEYGPPVTDWALDANFSLNNFGTVSNQKFFSRYVGDSLQVKGTWTSGTTQAAAASISISTYVIDSTKMASLTNAEQVGFASNETSGTVAFVSSGNPVALFYDGSTTTSLFFGANTTGSGFQKSNANAISASTHVVSVEFILPIAGKSSTLLMSNDTDTRVVAAIISGDPASATSGNPIIVPTINFDSHAAYNASTGRYTVPVSGIYKMYGALQSASSATTLTIYKNAVSTSLAGNLDSNGEATYASAVQCTAGDIIDLRPGGTVDATNMTLNIERISGPSAIASTESVNMRYFSSSSSISGSLATVTYTTKDFDSHGAYSSGIYTVPVSGKYQVNAELLITGTFALNNTTILELQKNNTVISRDTTFAFASMTDSKTYINDIISCVAGDTLRIQVSTSSTLPSIVSSNFDNFLSLARVGN